MTQPIACREVNEMLGIDPDAAMHEFMDDIKRDAEAAAQRILADLSKPKPYSYPGLTTPTQWQAPEQPRLGLGSEDVVPFNKRAFNPNAAPHRCLHSGDVIELHVFEDDEDDACRVIHVCRTCHSEIEYDVRRPTMDCPHDCTAQYTRISGYEPAAVCLLCREDLHT